MTTPTHLRAALLVAEGWATRRASDASVPQAPLDHPARTAPLSGTLDGSVVWLGWIEDDKRTWVAFVDRAGFALLWTSRDASGGVLGTPVSFQRDSAAGRDNGPDAVHVDKPIGSKAEPLLPSPTPTLPALRSSSVELLSPLVANGIALTLAAQHAHWNVRGSSFNPLHGLFGEVYGALTGHVDRLAERIATLGGIAPGALEMAAAIVASSKVITPLQTPAGAGNGMAFVAVLADRVDAYLATLAAAYGRTESMGDVATTNALADVQEDLEKLGWKLRAHLQ